MVPSFMAASAAAGTEYSRIHSRIVASSEVATWAKSLSARAAEPSTASVRPQSVTPKRGKFHGLARKREAEARAGMGTILCDPPFVPAEPCEVHICVYRLLAQDKFRVCTAVNPSPFIPAKAGIQGPRTRPK